jgi:hypothetical protein
MGRSYEIEKGVAVAYLETGLLFKCFLLFLVGHLMTLSVSKL